MTARKKTGRPFTSIAIALGESLPLPPDNPAISWYADGRIASRYEDLRWDLAPDRKSKINKYANFCYWDEADTITTQRSDLAAEMRWLFFLLIKHSGGRDWAPRTLQGYLTVLRKLARHCEASCLSIRELLSNSAEFWGFVSNTESCILDRVVSICNILAGIGSDVTGYSVPGDGVINSTREIAARYAETVKQCPPLPARIYSSVISMLTTELTVFQTVAERYLELTRQCVFDPLLGRTGHTKQALRRCQGLRVEPMSDLLDRHGLTEYFRERGLEMTARGMSAGLNRIMLIARLTIQAFSGMRDGEVCALLCGCIEEHGNSGQKHYVIHGITTKLNRGIAKKVRWVTNKEGARAINVARQITCLNYELLMRRRGVKGGDKDMVPLLMSVAYFGFGGRTPKWDSNQQIAVTSHLVSTKALRTRIEPVIEEGDLVELEQIDPHRAWRSEQKFQVGLPWTFTSHQLRRSLALYAQRSGLVSLPSLRRQLQHMTEEMSRYYAKGSAFAKDFIGNYKEHFAHEWQETQPVSSALSYIKNILLGDDVLFGGHGNWIEQRLRDGNGEISIDRELTLKRFSKGEVAYRDTMLGGCTNIGPCDKRPIGWLNIDCVKGCKHLVGQLKKLDRVIVFQKKLVASLDPLSVTHQSEKADLDLLLSVRDKVRAQAGTDVKHDR